VTLTGRSRRRGGACTRQPGEFSQGFPVVQVLLALMRAYFRRSARNGAPNSHGNLQKGNPRRSAIEINPCIATVARRSTCSKARPRPRAHLRPQQKEGPHSRELRYRTASRPYRRSRRLGDKAISCCASKKGRLRL